MSLNFISNPITTPLGTYALTALCAPLMSTFGQPAVNISAALTGSTTLNASLTVSPPTLPSIIADLDEFIFQLGVGDFFGVPTVSFGASAAATSVANLEAALVALPAVEAIINANFAIWGTGFNVTGNTLGTAVAAEYALTWPDGVPGTLTENVIILACPDIPFAVPPPFQADIASTKLIQFFDGVTFGSFPSANSQTFGSIGEMTKVTFKAIPESANAIQYQLDQAMTLAAHITVTPPSFAESIAAIAKFQAYLLKNVNTALPKVQFALNASANIMNRISGLFPFSVLLGTALNNPGAPMYVYTWSGSATLPVVGLAAVLTTELASTWGAHGSHDFPTALPCHVAMIGTLDPLAYANLLAFFAGAPLI